MLLPLLSLACAIPPPEHSRVLVVFDETNRDISLGSLTDPLEARGFEVTTSGVKDHPVLVKYGDRQFDDVLIIPGKTKALGSTLRQTDLLEFLKSGGNIVTTTTPKHCPLAIRELGQQLGIGISPRGVELVNEFESPATFPHPSIVNEFSESLEGAAVAKLGTNDLVLGLIQAPYNSYSWNLAKEDGQPLSAVTETFAEGAENWVAAGLQSLCGSRFVWVGDPHMLEGETGEQLTQWAFQETGKLRLANTTHKSLESGESHLHYKVGEKLQYCAQIEEWDREQGTWRKLADPSDVQLEFRMLDPYYRLNLDSSGCVEFEAPDQYGMFTFALSHRRPGKTFLEDKQVVTVRHRANDEWDRSWTISNSWVYLTGISTTIIGFLLFVVMYLALPEPKEVPEKEKNAVGAKKRKKKRAI